MSAVALYRDFELPWTPSEDEQRRMRRILGAVLGLFIAFGVIIPLLPERPKAAPPPAIPLIEPRFTVTPGIRDRASPIDASGN